MVKVSVVIPACNEEKTVGDVVKGCFDVLKSFGCEFEVIVVDDGSTDKTFKVAKKAGAKVFRHKKSLGQAVALKTGFKHCFGDIVVTMDADGQHNPKHIPILLKPILNGEADMVIGSRYLTGKSGFGFYREILDKIFISLIRILTGLKLTDTQSMFRAIKRQALLKLNIKTSYTMSTEMVIKAWGEGLTIKEVPIEALSRRYGKSHMGILFPIKTLLIIFRSIIEVR